MVPIGRLSPLLPSCESDSAGDTLPKGSIIPYNGLLSLISNGWALCDGTNSTPDLRDIFITGAGKSYALGDTGGEAVHQLTIAEMPKHNHKIALRFESNGGSIVGVDDGWNGIDAWTSTEYQGNDQPHENPPPYYALYYIRVKICAQCFLL